jgi:X-X-X-Leu-X-X-Gly heptad repeat protein
MKKTLLSVLFLGISLSISAQTIEIRKSYRLLEQPQKGFHPTFNTNGNLLAFTTMNYEGLKVYDFSNHSVTVVSNEQGAGFQPTFDENHHLFYKNTTFQSNLKYEGLKSFDLQRKTSKTILEPLRDLKPIQKYNNGIMALHDQKLLKVAPSQPKEPTPPYVWTNGQCINIYQEGNTETLSPIPDANGYIWASLSPNGQMILFHAVASGTYVSDLKGNIIHSLGFLNAPAWYNNDLVIGMQDKDDGQNVTESKIILKSLDGQLIKQLSDPAHIAMFPAASSAAQKIAYSTPAGDLYIIELEINFTPQPRDASNSCSCTGSSCSCTGTSCSCTGNSCSCTGNPCSCTGNSCSCTGNSCSCTGDSCSCTGNSRLSSGNSRLSSGNSRLSSGNSRLSSDDSRLSAGDSRLSSGDSRLSSGDSRLSSGSQNSPLFSSELAGVKIHINPGHGGWDSDDRGIKTPLFPTVGPNVGFWESQSNLDKGLQLRDMLEEMGCSVQMSRTLNRTEDDLALTTIVRMANEFGADFMLSIHSNAGAGTANYVLMLYAGKDVGDAQSYPTATPQSDKSREISTEIAKNLYLNELTYWTAPYRVSGDKTFGRTVMGWSDGYGVLRGLRVPGVISEGAMHDYTPETYRLMNMEYKWLEAWNFKKTFLNYFTGKELPTGNIAGWVKDSRNLILDGTYKKYSKDLLLPLNGATVSVLETGATYAVDDLRNGVYVFKDLAPGTYHITASADGYYPETEEVTVYNNKITYFNFELNKIRNTPPEVINYSPKVAAGEMVECSTPVVLEFNWDMDEESVRNAFSISPEVEGKITFEDSQFRMRFTPDLPLEASTTYTVKLDKSAQHPDNKSMLEDFTMSFMTKDRNRLLLQQAYPADGSDGIYYKDPVFWLIFDRKLSKSNHIDEIKVLDEAGEELSKPPRRFQTNNVPAPYGAVYFQLGRDLEVNKPYKIVVDAELADEVGVKVVEPIELNFTTTDVAVTGRPVIEDFEAEGKYAYDADKSSNVTGAMVVRLTWMYLFDKSAYELKGTFATDDAYVTYTIVEPATVVDRKKAVGMHVFGDLSGNELQLLFSNGTEVAVGVCDLNFVGWEFVEVELVDLPEGEDFTFTGIRIIRKEGLLSGSLDICIDNILLYDNSLVNSLPDIGDGGLRVYPNPASDVIVVETPLSEAPILHLYSFNGTLLKTVKAHEISVSEFAGGTYLLKIRAGDGEFGKVVIIKK